MDLVQCDMPDCSGRIANWVSNNTNYSLTSREGIVKDPTTEGKEYLQLKPLKKEQCQLKTDLINSHLEGVTCM